MIHALLPAVCPARRRWPLPRLSAFSFALLVAVLPASCRPPQATLAPGEPAAPRSCRISLPTFEPESGLPPDSPDSASRDDRRRSQIGATIELSLSSIASRIAAQVPPQASASQVSIGSAGLLTYSARRTPFSASLRGQRLHFTSQINATAEVCKPLGPLGCVAYASCQPAAVADASFGLEPSATWSLGPSNVMVVMTRPCALGPFDATSMIQRGANQQAGNLRAKIDASLPSLLPAASSIWKSAQLDAQVGSLHLRFESDQMAAGTPVIQGDIASIPVAVRGALLPRSIASSQAAAPGPPAPLSDPKLAPDTIVRVPVLLDSATLSHSLLQRLTSIPVTAASARATAVAVEAFPMSDGLRIIVELGGDVCGKIPFAATPVLDPEHAAVRLDDVKIALLARSALTRALPELDQRQLELAIQQSVSIPVSVSPDAVAETLGRSIEKIRPDGATTVEFGKRTASLDSVVLVPQGILAWVTIRQDARIVVR